MGRVIMYADTMSEAMKLAIDETKRRREIQLKYNKDNMWQIYYSEYTTQVLEQLGIATKNEPNK